MTTTSHSLAVARDRRQYAGVREIAGSASAPRVLQVVVSLNPGGTERLVIELVRRLQSEIPMAVCCLDEEGGWASELTSEGVSVTALHRRPGFRPALGRAIAEAAARHRATVMHCHQYSPYIYSCLSRLWRPGCRIVFTEHGRLTDSAPSAKRRLANQLFRRFSRQVFTVSDELRRHVVAEGFRRDGVGVIYNGISIGPLPDAQTRADVRSALAVAPDTFVVGTIARLDPVKDLGTLIHAVSLCQSRRPTMLVIVGDGPERAQLEAVARTLSVETHVKFLGHRNDARRWLSGCDVYVNSSISEGISLTILEAMAAGLPMVATRVGGTPEVVDSASGRLVEPRNATALAATLLELAERPGMRAALGRAARERVEALFSLDLMVAQYRAAYLGV